MQEYIANIKEIWRSLSGLIRVAVLVVVMILLMLAYLSMCSESHGLLTGKDRSAEMTQLKLQGTEMLKRELPDSALSLYLQAAGQYKETMTHNEKEAASMALNNAAYVYYFYKNDYSASYSTLLRALNIAESIGFKKNLPQIYLNMANIFLAYEDHEKAIELYRKAFFASIEQEDWRDLNVAFTNLAFEAAWNGKMESVRDVLKTYDKTAIPDSTDMLHFGHNVAEVMRQLLVGNDTKAAELLVKAEDDIDSEFSRERSVMCLRILLADIYIRTGETAKALSLLENSIEFTKENGFLDFESDIYRRLEKVHEMRGDASSAMKAHLHLLQVTDSLFKTQKYSVIRDIEAANAQQISDERLKTSEHRRYVESIVLAFVITIASLILLMTLWIYNKNTRLRESYQEIYKRYHELMEREESERQQRNRPAPSKDNEVLDGIFARVREFMETDPAIFESGFSIEDLAARLDMKVRQISQAVNEVHGGNFSNLLATYRIHEVCRRLENEADYGNLSIEGIGQSVGFQSRSNFVTTFKKHVGITPSEYRHQAKG